MKSLQLSVVKQSEQAKDLRRKVRDFIQVELEKGAFEPKCDSWLSGYSPEFSRNLGERGCDWYDLAETLWRTRTFSYRKICYYGRTVSCWFAGSGPLDCR